MLKLITANNPDADAAAPSEEATAMNTFEIILCIEVGIIAIVNLFGVFPPPAMIVIGVVLLLLGYFLLIPILETLGIILLIIGVVLLVLGGVGRPVAGRRYWF